jgi:hypothetical protein
MYICFAEGKRHDAAMLVDSGLLHDLEQYVHVGGRPMCVYGDPAYPHRVHLQAPYRNRQLTPEMVAFNKSMRSVRVSVEWLFGDIINYFRFLDFKKDLKIGLSNIGKMYIVAAVLRNALTSMQPNNTSTFFELQPPAVEEYFS